MKKYKVIRTWYIYANNIVEAMDKALPCEQDKTEVELVKYKKKGK